MTFGLTPTGFVAKTTEDILGEIETDERAAIAADLDVSAESVVGQINGVIAPKIAELWELAALSNASRDPNAASFAALDAVCAITGTTREQPTKGKVVLSVTLNAGITLPAGSIASVAGHPDNRWVTTESVTNTGGSQATLSVNAQASVAGPIPANSGTITVIATPVSGWTAVTNAHDASEGAPLESDPALRLKREEELSRPGSSPVDAIRSDLLEMVYADGSPVLVAASVEENASSYPDSLGRPPKTVEAVVQFPAGLSGAPLAVARQRVADQLWASKAGGIDTYGTVTGSTTDSISVVRTVRWTEPTLVDVYVVVSLSIDPATYVGDAAVKDAILAFGAAMKLGDDVIRARLLCAVIDLVGVNDVTSLSLSNDGVTFAEFNVSIGPRELASFDSSRITIVT